MAEVQTHTNAGEMTQLFVQFVMIHQQQALLALGRHPSPPPGAPGANLTIAKTFIDQLVMIRAKTLGNLSGDEGTLLNAAISSLQTTYAEESAKRS